MTCPSYCHLRKYCHSALFYSQHICLPVELNISQTEWTYSKYVLSSLPPLNVLSHYCLCHEPHKKFSKQLGQKMTGWDSASSLSTFVSFARLLYHNHPRWFYLPLPTNFDFHTNYHLHTIHYCCLAKILSQISVY